jgi:hypothetical protein
VDVAIAQRAGSPSWNPLHSDGTPLPPSWLLSAKLLAFLLFPARRMLDAGRPFLPFLPQLDAPFFATWLMPAVIVAFYAAVAALMVNRLVRAACVTIACGIFVHVAAHRLEYANSLLFPSVFLLLIGLYTPRTGVWPLRIQLALVYIGASLNKALDPDWWHGRFFDTLMIDALHVRWYALAAGHLPPHALGAIVGALTIAAEASIALAAILWRDSRAGIVSMIVFHTTMLVLTGGQLSVLFLCSALAIAPAFLEPSSSSERILRTPPLLWWAIVLFVRLLPRLLPYAQRLP